MVIKVAELRYSHLCEKFRRKVPLPDFTDQTGKGSFNCGSCHIAPCSVFGYIIGVYGDGL